MSSKWILVAALMAIVGCAKDNGVATVKADNENPTASGASEAGFRDHFAIDKSNLASSGDNHYMPLHPGHRVQLVHGIDTLTLTILNNPVTIDGASCAVLEERETKHGKLEEVSRNFFATDKKTGDVYYFGEEVDVYKNGKIVNHESAWRSGQVDARFGMQMPAKPQVGQKYYQELAPNVAMDRAEIVSTDETVQTPAGAIKHCLHIQETTPIENDVSDKYYAPGIGLIKDDEFELGTMP